MVWSQSSQMCRSAVDPFFLTITPEVWLDPEPDREEAEEEDEDTDRLVPVPPDPPEELDAPPGVSLFFTRTGADRRSPVVRVLFRIFPPVSDPRPESFLSISTTVPPPPAAFDPDAALDAVRIWLPQLVLLPAVLPGSKVKDFLALMLAFIFYTFLATTTQANSNLRS